MALPKVPYPRHFGEYLLVRPQNGKNVLPIPLRIREMLFESPGRGTPPYCRSYSPFPTRFRTVKPAFLASEMERALGELNVDNTLRTGFLHSGHFVNAVADNGRRNVNFPPQTLQSPSHNSYS